MRDWAYRFNLGYSTLKTRIGKGYSIEQALTMPATFSNGTKMRKVYPTCKRGHAYAEHGKVNGRGRRVCKICERDRNLLSAAARRACYQQTTHGDEP